jgi:hypothetical protein
MLLDLVTLMTFVAEYKSHNSQLSGLLSFLLFVHSYMQILSQQTVPGTGLSPNTPLDLVSITVLVLHTHISFTSHRRCKIMPHLKRRILTPKQNNGKIKGKNTPE